MDVRIKRLCELNPATFNEAIEVDVANKWKVLSSEYKTTDANTIFRKQHNKLKLGCGRFPEGHLIAYANKLDYSGLNAIEPVGMLNSLLIRSDGVVSLPDDWRKLTDNGCFTTHKNDGNTLVCASLSICKDYRTDANSDKFINFLLGLSGRLGVEHVVAYARPSGFADYAAVHAGTSIDDYVKSWEPGMPYDEMMDIHMRRGCRIARVLPNGRPLDRDTLGHCVIIDYSHMLASAR